MVLTPEQVEIIEECVELFRMGKESGIIDSAKRIAELESELATLREAVEKALYHNNCSMWDTTVYMDSQAYRELVALVPKNNPVALGIPGKAGV